MKKKNISVFIVVTIILITFTSCLNIYKKGVEYSDFPEKEIPIYDDAIVYSYEVDGDESELSYGTSDDIDDIFDFYTEELDDENLLLEIVEDKDEYMIEGFGDEIYFEIKIEEASGEKEKYYDSVVDIEVFTGELYMDQLLESVICGFWQLKENVNLQTNETEEPLFVNMMVFEVKKDGSVNLLDSPLGTYEIDGNKFVFEYFDDEDISLNTPKEEGTWEIIGVDLHIYNSVKSYEYILRRVNAMD